MKPQTEAELTHFGSICSLQFLTSWVHGRARNLATPSVPSLQFRRKEEVAELAAMSVVTSVASRNRRAPVMLERERVGSSCQQHDDDNL